MPRIFVSRLLVALFIGGLVVLPLAAQETGEKVVLQTSASSDMSVARVLLERESGQPLDRNAVSIDMFDLNDDNFPEMFAYANAPFFCPQGRCRPRLFALVGDSYEDILAPAADIAAVPAAETIVRWQKRNGYREIDFGGRLAVWDGKSYVDASTIKPTSLDAVKFAAACVSSPETAYAVDEDDPDPEATKREICSCVARGFGEWGLSQNDLDTYGQMLAGTLDDRAIGQAQADRLQTQGEELQASCTPTSTDESDAAQQDDTSDTSDDDDEQPGSSAIAVYDACLVAKKSDAELASGDRVMGYCSCVAASLETTALAQGDIDAVARFYKGEIDHDALARSNPDAIDPGDSIADQCMSQMPPRPGQRPEPQE